jgi:hypothetical protein
MYKLIIMVIGATLLMSGRVLAQDDLLELLEAEQDKVIQYTEATFKGSRLINGHTIETRKQGVLEFLISHRFGRINAGAYEFFGLDGANIRLGLEYGITDCLNIGVGRNSFEKTYDGFLKYKVLRQSSGECVMPFSVVGFTSMTVKTLKGSTPTDEDDFSSKLTYTYQLLIARKFNSRLSLQMMPTLIHRNVITEGEREHNLFALGAGGRYKITNRLSLNAEYYYRFNVPEEDIYYNSLSIGIDIETGGHVFQLHITNSQAMIEKGFIEETTGDFFKGDIHFGFNVSRSFNVNVKK